MTARVVAALVVFSVGITTPGLAVADKAEAEKLFRAGERYFESGRYDMAADAFERANETLPLPAIVFSAAQAHRLQYFREKDDSHLKRSVELYRQYIDKQKEGGRIKDAVTNLAELEPLLAAAESRGKVATAERRTVTQVILTSPIEGAVGSIDGSEMVALPHDAVVEPGRHSIKIEAKGYAPYAKDVDVIAGQMRAVEGELKPLPFRVTLRARSGAAIRVDGRRVGTAPLDAPLELEGGSHFVTAAKRGHRPFSVQFNGDRGESVSYEAPMPTTFQRKMSYVVLGTGGVLLVGSLAVGVGALALNSTAKDLEDKRQREGLTPQELDEYQNARNDRDLAQNSALGLFAVGAVVGGAGALLYYMDNPDPERLPAAAPKLPPKKSVRVAPIVSGDGAGVALSGRF